MDSPEIQQHDPDAQLTKDDMNVIRDWLDQRDNPTPPALLVILRSMLDLCFQAHGNLKSNKKIVDLLRTYMGFIPKKEREDRNQETRIPEWTRLEDNRLHQKVLDALARWKKYREKRPRKARKPRDRNNSLVQHAEESTVRAVAEPVFHPAGTRTSEEKKEISVCPDNIPDNLVSRSSSWQERTRFDLALQLTRITYRLETVTDPVTGFSITAKITDGPERYRVTWETLAQIVLLVAGMGIPMVRLASTIGQAGPYFDPPQIWRLLRYVARAGASIYLEIFRELSDCEIFGGDDTNSRVIEMRKDNPVLSPEELAKKESLLAQSLEEEDPQKADFVLEAEALLGTQRPRKDGRGFKSSVQTSVVIGERRRSGPAGMLVFYQTERKSLGDLMGTILAQASRNRSASEKRKPIVVQSDGSSQNIPVPYPGDLSLVFAGCAAHARRPFWRHRKHQDPGVGYYCYTMLLLFDKIFDSDRDARDTGKLQNILTARKEEQKLLWEEVREHCLEIKKDYAPNSEMGKAAEYILTNYDKLTYYLSDPRIRPDNNLSERLLRHEKTMLDNSKFRVTKGGRLVYDILRTLLSTCSAVGIKPMPYLIYLMKNQKEARKNPASFTPLAYSRMPG